MSGSVKPVSLYLYTNRKTRRIWWRARRGRTIKEEEEEGEMERTALLPRTHCVGSTLVPHALGAARLRAWPAERKEGRKQGRKEGGLFEGTWRPLLTRGTTCAGTGSESDDWWVEGEGAHSVTVVHPPSWMCTYYCSRFALAIHEFCFRSGSTCNRPGSPLATSNRGVP